MAEAAIAEIKAHCSNPEKIEELLLANNASFKGQDHQIDTYFKVSKGRLKLREGSIENTLIFYDRVESQGIKSSQVKFLKLEQTQVAALKQILITVHPILVVVDKQRKIFFIDNVKFHIDRVENLGSFVEIEAIGTKQQNFDELQKQCEYFQSYLGISNQECIASSYSDLILGQSS